MVEIQTQFIHAIAPLALNYAANSTNSRIISLLGNLSTGGISNEERSRIVRIFWIVAIVLLLILSTVFLFGSEILVSSYKPGIFLSTVTWAVFFGSSALLYLPQNTIVAFFGGILGVSLSEVSSGAGLISIANSAVADIAAQIGPILSGVGVGEADSFISLLVWVFVIVIGILCLPAFFYER